MRLEIFGIILLQFPLQLHNAVHSISAWMHLHRTEYCFSLLHPCFNSSLQICDIDVTVIYKHCHVCVSPFTVPDLFGQGHSNVGTKHFPQQSYAWYILISFCVKARHWLSEGWYRFSFFSVKKRSLRASMTPMYVLVLSYTRITIPSNRVIISFTVDKVGVLL